MCGQRLAVNSQMLEVNWPTRNNAPIDIKQPFWSDSALAQSPSPQAHCHSPPALPSRARPARRVISAMQRDLHLIIPECTEFTTNVRVCALGHTSHKLVTPSLTRYLQAVSPRDKLHARCTLHSPVTGLPTPYEPQATQILPRLYISDLWTATHVPTLKGLGITHRLSLVSESTSTFNALNDSAWVVQSKHIALGDDPTSRLWMYLESCVQWLEHVLSTSTVEGREHVVLVHCQAGRSRSVSIVLAYLMKVTGKSLDECYNYVAERRPVARPNSGFWAQLRSYEKGMFAMKTKREGMQCAVA